MPKKFLLACISCVSFYLLSVGELSAASYYD